MFQGLLHQAPQHSPGHRSEEVRRHLQVDRVRRLPHPHSGARRRVHGLHGEPLNHGLLQLLCEPEDTARRVWGHL